MCTLCRHISHVYDEKVGGNIGKEVAATVGEDLHSQVFHPFQLLFMYVDDEFFLQYCIVIVSMGFGFNA